MSYVTAEHANAFSFPALAAGASASEAQAWLNAKNAAYEKHLCQDPRYWRHAYRSVLRSWVGVDGRLYENREVGHHLIQHGVYVDGQFTPVGEPRIAD